MNVGSPFAMRCPHFAHLSRSPASVITLNASLSTQYGHRTGSMRESLHPETLSAACTEFYVDLGTLMRDDSRSPRCHARRVQTNCTRDRNQATHIFGLKT